MEEPAHIRFRISIPLHEGAPADLLLKIPVIDLTHFAHKSPVRWLLLIGYGTLQTVGTVFDVTAKEDVSIDRQELDATHEYEFRPPEDYDPRTGEC